MITSYYGDITTETFRLHRDFIRANRIAIEQHVDALPADNYVSRLTLSEFSQSVKEIKRSFSSQRYKYDLIVVEPKTAKLAALAARDNRVDVVRINPRVGLSTFNSRYASRLAENSKGIEIDLSFFFQYNMAKSLRPLHRILHTFAPEVPPVLLTNTPQKPSHLRSYRGLQSLGRLIGLSNTQTSGQFFVDMVEQNKKKREGKIPFPGVELDGSED